LESNRAKRTPRNVDKNIPNISRFFCRNVLMGALLMDASEVMKITLKVKTVLVKKYEHNESITTTWNWYIGFYTFHSHM
jgi:hypothetical protein